MACLYIYIYIYIYLYLYQKGNGSVRFASVPDFAKINQFGSVRFGNVFFTVRRISACVFRTRGCSVRFGSVRFRVQFRPVLELHGSVRFGRFGSASHSFLSLAPAGYRAGGASCMYCNRALTPTRRLPPVRSFTLKHVHLCATHVCFICVIMIMTVIITTGRNRFDSVRFGIYD